MFNGHAHTYQRIRPTGAGQVVSYVTGGGGGVPEPVDGGQQRQQRLVRRREAGMA